MGILKMFGPVHHRVGCALLLCLVLVDATIPHTLCSLKGGSCRTVFEREKRCSDLVSYVKCLHTECDKGTDAQDSDGKQVHDETAFAKNCQEAVSSYHGSLCDIQSCDVKCKFTDCTYGKSATSAIWCWLIVILLAFVSSVATRNWCRGEHGQISVSRGSQTTAPVTPAYGFFKLVCCWGLTGTFVVRGLQASQV